MDLKTLQNYYNEFGKTQPFWANISWPEFKHKTSGVTRPFFVQGEQEVARLRKYLKYKGYSLPRGKALDFGSGLGRVTQALSYYFDSCYGVDIAPSMIEAAKRYNKHGAKCQYLLNETSDLRLFQDNSFDFIYSVNTLQNIPPRYACRYIQEFLRVLAPGGLLIFQVPSEPLAFRLKVKQWIPSDIVSLLYLLKYQGKPRIEIYGVKTQRVKHIVAKNGGKLLDIQIDNRAFREWRSLQYCVTKPLD